MIRRKLISCLIYFLIVSITIESTISNRMVNSNGLRRLSSTQLTKLLRNYDSNNGQQVYSTIKYFYWPSTINRVNPLHSSESAATINRRQMETLSTPILIATNLATAGQSNGIINTIAAQDNSDNGLGDRWDRNLWFWPLILATALPIVIGAIVLPLAVFFLIELIFILLMMRNQAVQVTPIIPNNQDTNGQRKGQRYKRSYPRLYSNGKGNILISQFRIPGKVNHYNLNLDQNELIDFVEQQFIQSFKRYNKIIHIY